ncbi:MAG: hypothetical protein A2X82_11635 [Geobacteraceae bacterium GWC2_55_20]|nr:MAG: hypothetical protein A2X82_11635 [Geobacteraceae bacterium GWC2_55_20]OGU23353.1 MAG: hypothetical protein A2X85_17780 [Geobacteraceae bacterium GWF2_54_21]HCE66865.1 MucR family transcriptional regulator [Geobacter sp.]
MATLSELTVQVLTARMSKKEMTLEELQNEMVTISKMIKAIDEGTLQETTPETPAEEPKLQKINMKKVFKDNEVICLLCSKGFTTLKRHLSSVHQTTDKEYKKQFNIPAKQPLVAKAYSEKKKADALKNNLGAKMQAGRKAKAEITSGEVFESAVPAVKTKAAVPAKVAKKK